VDGLVAVVTRTYAPRTIGQRQICLREGGGPRIVRGELGELSVVCSG